MKLAITKVYQRYKNLQRHLEVGSHHFKPEKETLRDFVIRVYKDRVEGLKINRFSELRDAIQEVGSAQTCPRDIVTDDIKGWALPTRKVERFSKRVLDYLGAQFDEGVIDKRKKWKPEILAKEMRKDPQFEASDFLSAQQIAAYFSRLAARHEKQTSKQPEAPRNDDDPDAAEEEVNEPSYFENDVERENIDEILKEVQNALKKD